MPIGERFVIKGRHFETNYRIIGFCGKIYPFITITERFVLGSDAQYFLFSIEDIKEFNQKINPKAIKVLYSNRARSGLDITNVSDMNKFFKSQEYDFLKPLFFKYSVPSFILTDTDGYLDLRLKITLNPTLKNYGFVKVIDPVTAFQEIMNYISGVLAMPSKPMIKLSDKELAKKTGHDGKYSFRTPKQGTPKRPKRK